MTTLLAPLPKLRFVDTASGIALNGGKLFVYAAGTTTKINSYTDSTGSTPNSNPILLDARGECSMWMPPNTSYKVTLSPSTDTDPPTNPIYTQDNITISGLGGTNQINIWTAAQQAAFTTLTSSSGSIAVNLALSNNFYHAFTENTTIAAPTNIVPGQSGMFQFTQNASVAKTLAFSSFWKFPNAVAPTNTATLSATDAMSYMIDKTGTFAMCIWLPAFG